MQLRVRLCYVLVAFLSLLLWASPTEANSRVLKQIAGKNAQAMENYDLLEYEDAKRLLNEAVGLAKKHRLTNAVVAKTYLNLGIVYFSGFEDSESAKIAFIDAVQIDPNIEVDAAYRTKAMDKILAETKAEYGVTGDGGDSMPGPGDIDCASLVGIDHRLVDEATSGKTRGITAYVADDLKARKVTLYYRKQGSVDFKAAKMKKSGECTFKAKIPGKAIKGDFLHYYIAASNKSGKVVASKGSSGSPNIIEVAAATSSGGLPNDDENPLGNNNESSDDGTTGDGGEITKSGTTTGSTLKFFFSIGFGTGGGYVTGSTEQLKNDVGCCFAAALFHILPEVGFFLNDRTSVSAALRLGFPVGANLQGHAQGAPAGLLRIRHSLSEDGTGVQMIGTLGAGILRHTIKLAEFDMGLGGDTDTVASGPLLVGGGAGYSKRLGGPMRFVAEANVLAGIPAVGEIGNVELNFALQIDLNFGLHFVF